MLVTAQRMTPVAGMAQHVTGLLGQRTHGGAGRDVAASSRLAGDAAHRAPGNGGHGAQQVPRLRIPVQGFRDLCHSLS
jgi:hypothetical protein